MATSPATPCVSPWSFLGTENYLIPHLPLWFMGQPHVAEVNRRTATFTSLDEVLALRAPQGGDPGSTKLLELTP